MGIAEVSADQHAQAEVLVQLAGQQQPGVGAHRCATELDAQLGIEREANRAYALGSVAFGPLS